MLRLAQTAASALSTARREWRPARRQSGRGGERWHVSIGDVAAAAHVSTATVSRAIRGLPRVNPATRARILAIAEELGYVASPSASGLATGRTRTIGVVTPFVDRWYFARCD